jgi:DNA polymerase-3 subunit delta
MSPAAKSTDAPKAYVFAGDDDFRKQRELDDLLASLVAPDFADFDLEHMEGNSATADRIMAGLGIPPFSSSRRVVLVKYANKMDEDEQKKLASQLAKAPATGCLILVSPAPERTDGKPRKGSEIIGDLSKAVRKVGRVIRVGEEKGRERTDNARRFAQSLFAEAGKKIDSATLAAFLQRAGTDFSVLSTEARKLIDYSGDSQSITTQDVAKVTSETPEEKVFKLVDAIGARKPADAMRYLDELFETGDKPEGQSPKVLANIARAFRLIWQVKMLTSAGVRVFRKDSVPEDVRALLPSNPNLLDLLSRQSWQEERLKAQAGRVTREQLTRSFDAIARADAMLKGIEGDIEDARMVMELLVLELSR